SPMVFLISIALRTFSTVPANTANQLTHAGLIHHLLMRLVSIRSISCPLALCLSSFTFFLSLSVPPISDHLSEGRIYVTPASRFSSALLTPSADTLVLLVPLLLIT
ncbi:hypothetical protein PMAYCL1PPCAC_31267, partial [Pristionchus mayeri]